MAIVRTTIRNVAILSAVVRASVYLKSISCCPGAPHDGKLDLKSHLLQS